LLGKFKASREIFWGGNHVMKPKVAVAESAPPAIACQGGGSQTAFTAGVLKALFENKIQLFRFP
jgi:hypothetical protein